MSTEPTPPSPSPGEPRLREHSFDGIQEFDQRLPNWWLNTLYGAIAFAIVYWFVHIIARVTPPDGARVDAAMERISAAKMTAAFDVNDDDKFWEMSRNAVFVDSGKQTFNSLCATCHTVNLTGAVGPNLVDHAWLHGGTPKEIYHTVSEGVLAKGMPAWGPVLGAKKTAEVVAYILNHHEKGEPVEVQASFTPAVAPPPGG
jgi:cytochrome c oxidase cbb3-type subunit 3